MAKSIAQLPSRRMLEWGVMAALMVAVAVSLGHYGRNVQAQAERAAVLSTLGALRTALVLDHIQRVVRDPMGTPTPAPANPFLLIAPALHNYRGESSVVTSMATTPGSWLFDPQCQCVGYLPLDSDWSDDPSGARLLWFKVDEGPGARQMTAASHYRWRGVDIR